MARLLVNLWSPPWISIKTIIDQFLRSLPNRNAKTWFSLPFQSTFRSERRWEEVKHKHSLKRFRELLALIRYLETTLEKSTLSKTWERSEAAISPSYEWVTSGCEPTVRPNAHMSTPLKKCRLTMTLNAKKLKLWKISSMSSIKSWKRKPARKQTGLRTQVTPQN